MTSQQGLALLPSPALHLFPSFGACLFLSLVLTLSPVSFEPSEMKSLTKVCFQPRSNLPWGLSSNRKYPETLTPLLTDLVLLFFLLLGYQQLKKKLPPLLQQARPSCKNSLSDRPFHCQFSLINSTCLEALWQGGKGREADLYLIREQSQEEDGFCREFPHLRKDYSSQSLLFLMLMIKI